METPRDDQLIADLRVLRPTPRPEFAAELDERAAAGFPPRSHWRWAPFERLRGVQPRRLLIPAGGMAVLAIAVATVVAVSGDSGSTSQSSGLLGLINTSEAKPHVEPLSETPGYSAGAAEEGAAGAGTSASNAAGEGEKAGATGTHGSAANSFEGNAAYSGTNEKFLPFARDVPTRIRHRAVERNAELVLGADPADVADDSAAVFEAVHAHDGIVMRSSTREGEAGVAAARFELLIPSAKLSDALAALSAVDEVRSRHEATDDITAPTVRTGELLQDSKARIDSLLAQLEAAETDSEREAVEEELTAERRHRARLRAQLQHLERRADYSRVLVRIETGASEGSSGGGAWGIDDALGDAGHILAVAAAVSVVALAILGPIALVALLAWLTHRAWVRRERRRVLG